MDGWGEKFATVLWIFLFYFFYSVSLIIVLPLRRVHRDGW